MVTPEGSVVSGESKPKQSNLGQTVYIKCCLTDGREAFVPIRVHGLIYATAAGTYQEVTIEESDVPDEAFVIQ